MQVCSEHQIDEILNKIDNVKLEEVNVIIDKYFNTENLSLIAITKNNNGRLK